MRLGQISRKLNIKPTQIREFIRDEFKFEIDIDLNTKLNDDYVEALNKAFEKIPELAQFDEPTKQVRKVEVIQQIQEKQEFAEEKPVVENPVNSEEEVNMESTPLQSEPHDDQKEITASNENTSANSRDPFIPLPVDPDAEVIKVPKIKLEGLKVVGKIELPSIQKEASQPEPLVEQNEVEATIDAETVTPLKKEKSIRVESTEESEEEYSIYKDKRGIYHFSQQQRENRRNSAERIKLKKREEEKRRQKASHYKQVVKLETKEVVAKKKTKKDNSKRLNKNSVKPVRKGLWGKFLNWLND